MTPTSIRPILFSTPMVQGILAGRKNQTRRILGPYEKYNKAKIVLDAEIADSDEDDFEPKILTGACVEFDEGEKIVKLKFEHRDVLWVRETFSRDIRRNFLYKATDKVPDEIKWKPSLFMPKEACRICLGTIDLKVERLKEISKEDAIAEGVFWHKGLEGYCTHEDGRHFHCSDPIKSYKKLWEDINGEDSWEENPWVIVIEFKRTQLPKGFLITKSNTKNIKLKRKKTNAKK